MEQNLNNSLWFQKLETKVIAAVFCLHLYTNFCGLYLVGYYSTLPDYLSISKTIMFVLFNCNFILTFCELFCFYIAADHHKKSMNLDDLLQRTKSVKVEYKFKDQPLTAGDLRSFIENHPQFEMVRDEYDKQMDLFLDGNISYLNLQDAFAQIAYKIRK